MLDALPFPTPLYACLDLQPSPDGPLLLELEMAEPSLFFHADKDAADRLALALIARVQQPARTGT